MPRFLVERDFGAISDEEMLALALRSDRLGLEQFPDVVWEHSHLCALPDGSFVTYCVYSAPSEERLLAHADALGGHVIANLHVILDTVTPAELRKRASG